MKIQELIEQEDKKKPLTDQALTALIAEQEKTQLARRTIAKYREALNIPPTSQRRHK
jgi:RNA polymerase sigma-54 factor